MSRRVVVGIDGSPRALDAVLWAAAEAVRRGAGLRLVSAVEGPDRPLVGFPVEAMLEPVGRDVERAAAVAADAAPAVPVDQAVEVGHPVAVLAEESREAELLVVGASGFGRIAAALAGSVAVGVATHAACPVVVVRGGRHGATAPVVLGVEPSPAGEAAIAFAFGAAAMRRVPLVAVHTSGGRRGGERSAPRWGALDGWAEHHPGVAVRRITGDDHPARRLLELSEEAQLVVVGSRGYGELVGLFLDSVSHAVLHGAACPVAVVRPRPPDAVQR